MEDDLDMMEDDLDMMEDDPDRMKDNQNLLFPLNLSIMLLSSFPTNSKH